MTKENSRQLIIDTALKHFVEKGYDRTSIAFIAKKAGVAQGLLYNYYTGKDELLLDIFHQGMADIQSTLVPASSGAMEIPHFIGLIFDTIQKNRDFWRLVYALRMQPYFLELLKTEIESLESFIMGTLMGVFEARGSKNPRAEAETLFGVIDGVCIHYTMKPDNFPLEEVKKNIISLYKK